MATKLLLAAALLFCFSHKAFSDNSILLSGTGTSFSSYNDSLLRLVLSEVETPYELKRIGKSLKRKRLEVALEQGNVDIAWLPASSELEAKFIALKYPIYKGLTSYRFALIKKSNSARLKDVKTIDELKENYTGGAGRFWSTTKIYQQTGFQLRTAVKKPSLFYMLEGERFDYFLRGVNEIKREIKEYADLDLMIDPNVIVFMPTASYMFINPKRPKLAADLEKGFQAILHNGKYDAYVKNSYLYKDLVDITKNTKRRILQLNYNPYNLPKDDPDRWINLEKLASEDGV